MTRVMSAARIKQQVLYATQIENEVRTMPRAGSGVRKIYDCFLERKGLPIYMTIREMAKEFGLTSKGVASSMENLRNFYGLDIRRIRNGEWVLAGEWVGNGYVDYIAARLT